jgi:ribosome biogenesis GTPase
MTKRRLTDQQTRRIKAQRSSAGDAPAETGQPGVVIARYGKQALIETRSGDRLLCHLRAHLESPVAGDEILWLPTEETGVVDALVTRRNVLQRPDPQGRLRPVAANIDLMLIVFAPEPAPQANLIDRYLVAAENMEVEAALVLNKADLLEPGDELARQLDRYGELGYRTLTTHHELPGASDLTTLIGRDTLVLVGQSGVGKSSLIQRLLPEASIRVGALSEVADKGRHTTTTAELFHLPGGGRLIDSPGVRDFGLTHVAPDTVFNGFREFSPFLGQCRFRDCQHQSEPGCALTAAVENGDISSERFDSFRQIVATLATT